MQSIRSVILHFQRHATVEWQSSRAMTSLSSIGASGGDFMYLISAAGGHRIVARQWKSKCILTEILLWEQRYTKTPMERNTLFVPFYSQSLILFALNLKIILEAGDPMMSVSKVSVKMPLTTVFEMYWTTNSLWIFHSFEGKEIFYVQ